jgi:hypothetical protein
MFVAGVSRITAKIAGHKKVEGQEGKLPAFMSRRARDGGTVAHLLRPGQKSRTCHARRWTISGKYNALDAWRCFHFAVNVIVARSIAGIAAARFGAKYSGARISVTGRAPRAERITAITNVRIGNELPHA